jgi:membrane protein DedA with SNARE-associated domain
VFGFIDEVFDHLADWSQSHWFYAVIFGIALLDSILPIVPSETAVILGGIAAAQHHLNIWVVIAAGALGAMVGDNTAYGIGKRFSPAISRWYNKKPKRARKLAWATTQLRRRGGTLLLTARFIPGGRTIITIVSGITRQKRWKFILFVLIACCIWASYAGGIGYFFGDRFEGSKVPLLIALGASLAITILIELIRRKFTRRRMEPPPGGAPTPI